MSGDRGDEREVPDPNPDSGDFETENKPDPKSECCGPSGEKYRTEDEGKSRGGESPGVILLQDPGLPSVMIP